MSYFDPPTATPAGPSLDSLDKIKAGLSAIQQPRAAGVFPAHLRATLASAAARRGGSQGVAVNLGLTIASVDDAIAGRVMLAADVQLLTRWLDGGAPGAR